MSASKLFWPNIFCLKITNTFLFCYFNIYSNKNLSNLKGLKIEDTQKHKIVTDTGYRKGGKRESACHVVFYTQIFWNAILFTLSVRWDHGHTFHILIDVSSLTFLVYFSNI